MVADGDAELCVRSIAGHVILAIPYAHVAGLTTIDLKYQLLDIIHPERVLNLVGLQLLIGHYILKDRDILENHWPESSSVFEICLVLRKAIETDDIKLAVSHLLSRLYQQDIESAIEHMATIELGTASQLRGIVDAILAQSSIRPDCSQGYARMVSDLRFRYPEFPPEDRPHGRRVRPVSLMSLLIGAAQEHFDDRPAHPDAATKREMSNRLKFLANLFELKLLDAHVVRFIVEAIVGSETVGDVRKEPPPYFECVFDFIELVGPTLCSRMNENMLMLDFIDQLGRFRGMPWCSEHMSSRIQRISSIA
eukprot:TRINITY_DN21616_c0_g1_i2.p1 TRINITY_DN21616_c0_g1~~TRINITY_DN21616_c0_g1_i2.p1  ORF type:complete len:326 (-),score=28.07 TRINITY_DN21616_c0_g1_i2:270-1193(-)